MKQHGIGIRLVQRKFAQGVPVPTSHIAPLPPERKEPVKEDQRTVYHSRMSARNLLDIVSLQNVHKHKQPMVLVERLRVDDIPSTSAPTDVVKKRPRIKTKKSMCLRPRDNKKYAKKRKTRERIKGPVKKRARIEDMSTDDDTPLLYLRKNPVRPVGSAERTTRARAGTQSASSSAEAAAAAPDGPVAPKVPVPTIETNSAKSPEVEKKEDSSVTFKRPSEACILKFRQFQRRRSITPSLPTGRSYAARAARPARRSGRLPTAARPYTPELIQPRRAPRARVLPGKPKTVIKRVRRNYTDGPAIPKTPKLKEESNGSKSPVLGSVERTTRTRAGTQSASSAAEAAPATPDGPVAPKVPVPTIETISAKSPVKHLPMMKLEDGPIAPKAPGVPKRESNGVNSPGPAERRTRSRSVNQSTAEAPVAAMKHLLMMKSEDGPIAPKAPGVPKRESNGVNSPGPAERRTRSRSVNQSTAEAPVAAMKHLLMMKSEDGPIAPKASVPKRESNGVNSPGPAERRTRSRSVNQSTAEAPVAAMPTKLESAPAPPPDVHPARRQCPSTAYNSVQEVVVAASTQCPRLAARCRACRGCGIVAKILQLTELVRADNPIAVYDFNTELDEAMCPSLSCLRVRRRLARAAGDHIYLDLLPPDMPQIIQILCKKTVDKRLVSAVSVVDRDVAASADQPTLLEHENLLDQLLECMGRRAHAQPSEPDADTPVPEDKPTQPVADPVERADEVTSNGHEDDDLEPGAESGPPPGAVVDAPVFRPTPEEFTDPIAYYTKIQPEASKYGLCKVVPPPGFDHPCNMNDHIRFAVIYQYISKLYNRWGPVARELAAIKAHLRTQSVVFARPPLLDGREVNLPKLYHSVERHGGPTKVIQKKRWGRVAEEMKLTKLQNPERKLDQIYMRYLLPYATLSNQERQDKMTDVERYWTTKYQKMLARARNPLHRQKRLLGESESSSDSGEDDTADALEEAEDCIVRGRTMNLATFKKIASSLMEAQFPAGRPDTGAVERAYWRSVLLGTDHVVANTASLDTGEEGHGFPKDFDHPWNLKMLANNPENVLRYLGPVLGVTVPTLHLSMLFSTSCWHRDPHGLPWVEYMHSGPDKIWYGIPSSQSSNFRRAVETLCPAYCQNKSIWLASDIAMIPPEILSEHGVALARAEQRPGEFVMVFPEAHSCSITTGFSVSESVYFAPCSWLDTVQKLFQELRDSCEPTMFSLEQLLLSGARAGGAAPPPLAAALAATLRAELRRRAALQRRGVQIQIRDEPSTQSRGWHARAADECEYCRASLYLSKVVGLTARRTPLCTEHAQRLLDAKKYRNVDARTLELHSAYSTAHLEALLTWLEP